MSSEKRVQLAVKEHFQRLLVPYGGGALGRCFGEKRKYKIRKNTVFFGGGQVKSRGGGFVG